MDGGAAGALCCGRCGGPAAAARAARRQRFRAAVFARPGGDLSAAGSARRTARGATAARAATPGRAGGAGEATGGAAHFRAVTGTLLDISPHILVVATDAGEQRFALTAGAAVWHGGAVHATELRPGERVVARLAPGRKDVADKVWAGIGRVAGTISESGAGQLTVAEGTSRTQAVVIAPAAANRIRVRFPHLEPGNLIDLIGLRHGAVLEALVPATSQPAYLASRLTRVPAVVKTAAGTFSGSATWHEPAGPGEEPRGVAYPAIDPAAGCAEAALAAPCPAELPYLAVGSMVSVRNDCTGAARVLPVTSCGAAARLFHDRCLNCGTSPRGRVADLTLASFVELGGDPERACFNATIAVRP